MGEEKVGRRRWGEESVGGGEVASTAAGEGKGRWQKGVKGVGWEGRMVVDLEVKDGLIVGRCRSGLLHSRIPWCDWGCWKEPRRKRPIERQTGIRYG